MLLVSWNSVYTADIRTLINDLAELSVNEFQKIRNKAHIIVVGVLHRFPLAVDMVIDHTLALFKRKETKDEPLHGALNMLLNQSLLQWETRKWRRLSNVLLTLCQSASQ